MFLNNANNALKRLFDIIFSSLGIIILSPFLIIIAVSIKLDSKGPVIFKQVRVGRRGNPFKVFKFRTMINDAEKYGEQITVGGDKRITKIGAFLRKYKIDEFPQLFNILRGDMSFVGPRPEVPKYVALYNDEQKKVLNVRPGLTDIASIKYKNENEILKKSSDPINTYIKEIMPEKLGLYKEYINNYNIHIDMKLIFKTIIEVFLK